MEIEVILQFILVFALGLCVGLPFSSRLGTKHLKEHVRFLEGKINRARQDKPDGGGGLMGLLSGGLDEKSIMKFLGNENEINVKTKNPEFLEWKWIEPSILTDLVVDFKFDIYNKIKQELRSLNLN